MGSLNDLMLPVIDASEDVWASFFCAQELAAVKALVMDLQQPMLNMGGIFPLDLDERLINTLQIVVGAVDVSCFSFYHLILCSFLVVVLMSCLSEKKSQFDCKISFLF